MTTVPFYDKDQVDSLLGGKADTTDLPSSNELVPDTTGASQGDVLTVGASGAEWAAPSGGGPTVTQITTAAQFKQLIASSKPGDMLMLWDSLGAQVSGIFYKAQIQSGKYHQFVGSGLVYNNNVTSLVSFDADNNYSASSTRLNPYGTQTSAVNGGQPTDSWFDDPCYFVSFRTVEVTKDRVKYRHAILQTTY